MGVKVRASLANDSLARITESLQTMDAVLENLLRDVAVLQASWSGDARDAFATSMAAAHASVARLRSIALSATDEAQSAVGRFHDFDRRRQGAWPL